MSADRFGEALDAWEVLSDSTPMVELLNESLSPLGIEVTASQQKGCDCPAIEIEGHWVCPYDDIGSGSAIVYGLDIIRQFGQDSYPELVIECDARGYCIYTPATLASRTWPNLILAVLEALTLLKQS